jgi:hypothetical protein
MVRAELFDKLRDFEVEHMNLRLHMGETKGRVAAGELPAQALQEVIEKRLERCLAITRWCVGQRDAFLRELDDPEKFSTLEDRESRRQFCNDVDIFLEKMKADCPPGVV